MKGILRVCWVILACDAAYVAWLLRQPEERHFATWQTVVNVVAFWGGALLLAATIVLGISWSRVRARVD